MNCPKCQLEIPVDMRPVVSIVDRMFSRGGINSTAREIFFSTPKAVLRRLIQLTDNIIVGELPAPNRCWHYNVCILMSQRAEQVLSGTWKEIK